MPDEELDQRLRRLLSTRANTVNPQPDGPTLRAAATDRPSALRRAAAPLSLAAAIVLLAFTPSLLAHSNNHPHHQPPGVSISVSVPPISTPTPTPTPTRTPTPSPTTATPSPAHTSAPTVPTAPQVQPTESASTAPIATTPITDLPSTAHS